MKLSKTGGKKMEEKIIAKGKNGMLVLLLNIVLYLVAIAGIVFGALMLDEELGTPILGVVLLVISITYVSLGWILFCGLRVLKPQEALVLTLFGKYIGTLKGEGFYFVNPFCSSVNPAAKTRLNQSGDVDDGSAGKLLKITTGTTAGTEISTQSKKISLKVMTLNNNRQKVNDCLGNPVEIGIAVMWRVVDTAKAVFNVDNYKIFYSRTE